MKKILFVLAAMSVAASCCVDRDTDGSFWGAYNRRKQKFESYPADVMDQCVWKPVLTLDYVMRLRHTLYASGENNGSGTYVVADVYGHQVGPIECLVFADDTTWFFDSGKYVVKHDGGNSWKVTGDYEDVTSVFRYEFELNAVQRAEVGDSIAHRPWHVEVSGKRTELGSDYWLDFQSSGFDSRCDWPKSFSGEVYLDGTLGIRFYKDDEELDWLESKYAGDSIVYRKSF